MHKRFERKHSMMREILLRHVIDLAWLQAECEVERKKAAWMMIDSLSAYVRRYDNLQQKDRKLDF
jgi:hypothetical protein